MILNDFKLGKYRNTVGCEGEGFTATLLYKGKPVAEYADYADGAMGNVWMSKDGWGQAPLLETMRAIDDALNISFLETGSPASCAEFLCEMLAEGRAIDSSFKKLAKSYPKNYIGLYLSGDVWAAAPFDGRISEGGLFHAVCYTSEGGTMENTEKLLREDIREAHERGDFKKLACYFLLEPGTPVPLVLSTEAYIQAFQQGKALQQTLENNSLAMGMEPTQG